MSMRETLAWKWGEIARQNVGKRYLELGWYVVPTDAIENGGAPKLIGAIKSYALPDMQIFKPGGTPRWVEVKWKDHADKYQKLQQWQHGVDLPNWIAYLEVEQKTGIAGQLDILQYRPGVEADPKPVHLFQWFSKLRDHVQILKEPHTTFHRGAAYFPIDAFDCAPITVPTPQIPAMDEKVHPWGQKSKAGIAPAWPIKYTKKSPLDR